jgi:hypothetical protein
MHLMCILLLFALLPFVPAWAQQAVKEVTREQSRLVLDMPGTQGERATFSYLGWTSGYTMERHFAFSSAASGFPHARVWMTVLAKTYLWTGHFNMNETTFRELAPHFKDKIVRPARERELPAFRNVVISVFDVEGVECAMFSLRSLEMTGVAVATAGGAPAFFGVYCGSKGSTLSREILEEVLEGIYFRQDGTILRALGLRSKPVPSHVIGGPGAATPASPVTAPSTQPATTAIPSPPPSPTAPQPATRGDAIEITFWDTIRGSRNPDDFEAYLRRYPDGAFGDLARIRLQDLRRAPAGTGRK